MTEREKFEQLARHLPPMPAVVPREQLEQLEREKFEQLARHLLEHPMPELELE